MSDRTRRNLGALALAAATVTSLAAAPIPPVTATSPSSVPGAADEMREPRRSQTVHVSGLLRLVDATTGTYAATGDLTGTWTMPPTRAEDLHSSKTALIQKGVEFFDGCVRGTERCGTLNSEYISWTYLRSSGRLISGGCVHAPTGGTKGFRGVRGLLLMTDTPVGDDVNTLYQGEMILDAEPQEAPIPVPASGAVSTGATTSTYTDVEVTDATC